MSKHLEEQCGAIVVLLSLGFQGVKIIDVIEESPLGKSSVAFESGDVEVDFVRFFPIHLRAIFGVFDESGASNLILCASQRSLSDFESALILFAFFVSLSSSFSSTSATSP